MEIPTFIIESPKGLIALDVLTTVAATRAAHGDDVLAAFRSQIELRSTAAQKVLDTASAAGRDTLLASEQRDYDRQIRERDAILGLQRSVEARTAQVAFVPPAITSKSDAPAEELSPVVTRDQKVSEWLEKRGGYNYAGDRELARVSLGRIIRALTTGKRDGMSALEQRVMSEGSGAAGQFLVPEILGTRIIDQVRVASVLGRAGVTVVPMTSETLALAKVESGPTAAWKLENAAIAPSDVTLGRLQFTAHTLPILVKMSIELFEDATNISTIVEREIAAAIAMELDRVGLRGSGVAPEPEGVRFADGVTLVPFADTGSPADGVPGDFDFLVDLIGTVRAENFNPTARIYNSALATTLAKLKDTTRQPLRAPQLVLDVPELIANGIANDLGAGGSPATGDGTEAYVGDFAQLMLGMRTTLTLEISRQAADTDGSAFRNMQVWIRGYIRADYQLARPEAFAISTGVQAAAS